MSEGSEERTFTVEEANGLLPDLRTRLDRIRQARQIVIQGGERVREAVAVDGGGTEGTAYFAALRTLREGVERFAEDGILLRDPESGVVDFPAKIDGREGFLCWRADEDAVEHWHPPQTGFAGRLPL